jgi:hypothetical protein
MVYLNLTLIIILNFKLYISFKVYPSKNPLRELCLRIFKNLVNNWLKLMHDLCRMVPNLKFE